MSGCLLDNSFWVVIFCCHSIYIYKLHVIYFCFFLSWWLICYFFFKSNYCSSSFSYLIIKHLTNTILHSPFESYSVDLEIFILRRRWWQAHPTTWSCNNYNYINYTSWRRGCYNAAAFSFSFWAGTIICIGTSPYCLILATSQYSVLWISYGWLQHSGNPRVA